jgi:hypothetical protein
MRIVPRIHLNIKASTPNIAQRPAAAALRTVGRLNCPWRRDAESNHNRTDLSSRPS